MEIGGVSGPGNVNPHGSNQNAEALKKIEDAVILIQDELNGGSANMKEIRPQIQQILENLTAKNGFSQKAISAGKQFCEEILSHPQQINDRDPGVIDRVNQLSNAFLHALGVQK